MPVFQLPDEPLFPPTHLAEPSGLLAIGGDLTPERLVQAYAQGIFPWFSEGDPILWHAPPERMVLWPDDLRINRSLRKFLRRCPYRVTLDVAFDEVIAACAQAKRRYQDGTWITSDMMTAYTELHRIGLAHSVEAWLDARLVGGLYGVSLGTAFFGESMFARANNASKVAFVTLVEQLQQWGFSVVDCQVHTELLASFGAVEVPRDDFEEALQHAIAQPTKQGPWAFDTAADQNDARRG